MLSIKELMGFIRDPAGSRDDDLAIARLVPGARE